MDRKSYDLERYHRLRSGYLALVGSCCAKCGSVDTLELDHIDPSTKSFDICSHLFRPREVVVAELKKCQVLCKSCHKIKSYSELSVSHGGGLSGKRNCPCALCKAKKAQYMRKYKADKK